MAIFSGSLPEYSGKTSGGITWTVTVDYIVTPSDDLINYSVELTLKAKRSGSGTSYNYLGTSYIYYTVNGVQSSKQTVSSWEAQGGKTITLGTYTYSVASPDIDFSVGIPVEVYWYTGILETDEYSPSSVTVSGSIEIPEEYAGLVYIDNGTGWDAYAVYIDNGTSWERYIPYIDNGTGWDMCS